MNPLDELAALATRVATLTSRIRANSDDERRLELHGGTPAELVARVDSALPQWRKLVSDLEKTLA